MPEQMDLLAHESGPALPEELQKLYALVKNRQGKAAAISAAELVSQTGIPDRKMRDLVKALVEEHGIPIGSCPSGFFIAETAEEIDTVCHTYLAWAFSLLKRAKAFKRNSRLDEILGQLKLEMETN